MSHQILVTTTGVQSPITFNDLGSYTLFHPTVDDNFLKYFTIEELEASNSFQNAIDLGWITVKDEDGNPINQPSEGIPLHADEIVVTPVGNLSSENVQDALQELQGDIDNIIATGGDKNYVHNQGTPSSVWNVAHNLNKRVSVSVVDSAGTEVEGDIQYIDDNIVTLRFSAAFSGKAYFN